MFEDWACALSDLDVRDHERTELRRMLAASARLRAALDRFDAQAAARLGESASVRSATRCTQREADQAVERGRLITSLPEVDDALSSGAISAAHVDVLARAAGRTSVDAVGGSRLLELAKAKPADAMRRQVDDFVRRTADADDLQARADRQRADRRATMTSADMGILHVEWDDVTFAEVRAAVDAEADRLWRHDGGREGAAEVRTPQQRRADAVAALLLRRGGGEDGHATPSPRTQMVVVAETDGTAVVPGVGPLPPGEVERLACISDLYGVVFDGRGVALWHGRRRRLADDHQIRALIARDAGCICCGAHPARCEAHHVRFRRDGGATDVDNLVLVCRHHHHLIHDQGWRVSVDPAGAWTLAPP